MLTAVADKRCSLCEKLLVVPGALPDYERLARYHYRADAPGVFTAVFALKPKRSLGSVAKDEAVGVIVYTMPTPQLQMRDVATGGCFGGFDRRTRLALLNRYVRCISRVVIDPRFRGLGLAARLVRETMGRLGVRIIEAMAVMGRVNPFLEKAGMTAYQAPVLAACAELTEAFDVIGVNETELIDPQRVQTKLEALEPAATEFIERRIRRFLQRSAKRRHMPAGPERTRYVLSRLTYRPVYYIWFNPDVEDVTS